ncbi:tRNA N(3)-methylcytidine methyltransferase trm141-like [Magnolia sinica]|uniref:tRNA N(3)-methylcytidine methyltransferase trm141-like n=1 Tax=Magnolia sinica TaxID=86752 RepID=UPI0026594C3D|nr:tRNA N(3)-methylcytidine methyltransferase trm141-like [Magnolia sinica]
MIRIRSFHPSRSLRWPRSPSPINGQQRLISTVRLGLDKYERSASKHWNDFYKRHQSKFFKDRHYLEKDWGRFFSDESENCKSEKGKVVLEVGCGVGNTIFPLITAFPNLFIHACDFSPLAIKLVKEHGDFRADRVNAFVSDVTVDDLSKKISPSSVDVVTLIFALSAVSPKKMPFILQNIRKVLKPNGYVLLRDYANGDFAQEKLTGKDRLISENFYVRGDGTCAFYFTEDFLTTLFEMDGFSTVELSMYSKKIENRSRKIVMDRILQLGATLTSYHLLERCFRFAS